MEQGLSWESNGSAASQESPCILWNANVNYRVYVVQELATFSYPEPDESSPCPLFFFLKSILILSSLLRLGPKRSLSIRFFPPKPRLTWFDNSNQIVSHKAVKFGGGGGARVRRLECTSATVLYRSDKSLLWELFCTAAVQSWDMELVVVFISVGFG